MDLLKAFIVLTLLITGITLFFALNDESPKLNYCYYPENQGFYFKEITDKECDEIHEKFNERISMMNKLGKDIGCTSYSEYCESGAKRYQWNEKRWIETTDSKRCSKYETYKVADVPVNCLSYWNITK